MTDETIDNVDTTDIQEPDKATVPEQVKTVKTFTQDELNKVVAREKAAWKKSAEREKETLASAELALRGDIEFYEEKFQKIVEAQTADFDPIMLDLFNALPLRERLEKLSDEAFMAKVRRKNTIPETPKFSGEGGKPLFVRKQSV